MLHKTAEVRDEKSENQEDLILKDLAKRTKIQVKQKRKNKVIKIDLIAKEEEIVKREEIVRIKAIRVNDDEGRLKRGFDELKRKAKKSGIML